MKNKVDYLYHYTRFSTLEKIFNDKSGKTVELQLTDHHFLNDAEEGIYFYNFLMNNMEQIAQTFDSEDEQKYCAHEIDEFLKSYSYEYRRDEQSGKNFIFSFSELKDSMQFWRQDYANDRGVALAFNKSKFENFSENLSLTLDKVLYLSIETFKDDLPHFFEKVKEESELINHVNDIEMTEDGAEPRYYLSGCDKLAKTKFLTIKNKVWESECEWRLIFGISALTFSCQKDKFSLSGGLGLYVDDKGVPRYKIRIPNPFDEVVLGPSFPENFVKSVNDWFFQHGYKNMKISKSQGHERPRF